ncbi:Uncharacterised protein [uncultured archaeon]|nr:Uncharacterised protein [uncultured archaeon]
MITDSIDDEKRPFFADSVYKILKWTRTNMFAIFTHDLTFLIDSDYKTINLIV